MADEEQPTRGDLIEEVIRLNDELDRVPSAAAMKGRGQYQLRSYLNEFGSWEEALDAAGFTSEQFRNQRYTAISDEKFLTQIQTLRDGDEESIFKALLLLEIRQLAIDLGKTPSVSEMNSLGEYSWGAYRNRWSTWSNAVSAAGLEPNSGGQGKSIPREDLLDEIRRLATALDRRPTQQDLQERGQYSRTPYYREFGAWEAACQIALDG